MVKRFWRWVLSIGRDQRGVGPLTILLIASAITFAVVGGNFHLTIADYFGWGSTPGEVGYSPQDCTPVAYVNFSGNCLIEDQYVSTNHANMVFEPGVTFDVSSGQVYAKRVDEARKNVTITLEVWTVSADRNEPHGWHCALELVSSGSLLVELTADYEWHVIGMSGGVVRKGEMYGLRIKTDGNQFWLGCHYDGCFANGAKTSLLSDPGNCSETGEGFGGPDYDRQPIIRLAGCYWPEASVRTVNAYFSTYNEVVLQGFIEAIGGEVYEGVNPQFEWGFLSGALSEKYRSDDRVLTGKVPFEMRLSGLPLDETVYFRAGIYGVESGTEYWGSELSFAVPSSEGAMLTVEVLENNENRVLFECEVHSLGGATAPDLKLFYGETMAEMLSGNYSVTVSSALAGTGRWSYTDSWAVFDDGKEYFVRTGLVVGGEATAHSDVLRFHRYDTTQPGGINWLANLLGIGLDWLWWLILIAGLVFVWTFAMTGGRSSPVLGVVGSFVVLGFAIAFGFVNAWVVVLMAILAGWVIFKIIFKHSGGTG